MDPDQADAPVGTPEVGSAGPLRPAVDAALAGRIALDLYGRQCVATELGSNRDRNFLLRGTDGSSAVLKIDNAASSEAELAAQNEAILHVSAMGVPVARVLSGNDGGTVQRAPDAHGRTHFVRLFEHVPGGSMADAGYLPPETVAGVGALAAEMSASLAGFRHAGLEREPQWDLRRGLDMVEELLPGVGDAGLAESVLDAAIHAVDRLGPLAGDLPVQAVHGNLGDDNIVAVPGPDGRPRVGAATGFGDLAYSWRVAELAVTVASLLHHQPDRPLAVLPAVRMFHDRTGLARAEAEALWPLVVLRAAVLVASGWQQTAPEADSRHAAGRRERDALVLSAATLLPLEVATAAVLAELGFPPGPAAGKADSAPGPVAAFPAGAYVLDLGVESPLLDAGRWLESDAEDRLAAEALRTHASVVLPYGTPRLTRTAVNAREAAATVPLALQIYTSEPVPLAVPWDCTVVGSRHDMVEFEGPDGSRLRLAGLPGLEKGRTLSAGEVFGQAPSSYPGLAAPLTVSWAAPGTALEAPAFCTPELAPAWRRLTRDPAPLFGLPPVPATAGPEKEQLRRNRIIPSAQERYFAQPPQVERGWRQHLVDTDGRAYVDMVDNAAGIGHGHPAVADAANGQLRLLTTDSRFLYRSLADYGERLAALAPEGLDTVLLVDSGTEAVDLAVRLAWAATGRRTVVSLREASHGWSIGAHAVAASAHENPGAPGSRPGWVHVADVPNPLRGTYSGIDAGVLYAADLAADLDRLHEEDRPAAAFICESVLGNAGGVLLPDGYLAEVYAAVRAHGGLCIADEVQAGFGRTGEGFWAFGLQGVVPDIIAIAQPMGNGFPIGGVITTRAIAEALGSEGTFFSSAGGSPVSCRVGLAVLDAMESEDLVFNAHDVGAYLLARLEELRHRHAMVVHVHGTGLCLGVELVRSRDTLEPAAAEAAAICERLRGLGVVVQPVSERQNVLKFTPPLCLTRESADFVADALDHVLTTGW